MDHSAPATVKVTHLAMQNTLLNVEKIVNMYWFAQIPLLGDLRIHKLSCVKSLGCLQGYVFTPFIHICVAISYRYVTVCVHVGIPMPRCMFADQGTTCRRRFFLSTMWVPGMKLRFGHRNHLPVIHLTSPGLHFHWGVEKKITGHSTGETDI